MRIVLLNCVLLILAINSAWCEESVEVEDGEVKAEEETLEPDGGGAGEGADGSDDPEVKGVLEHVDYKTPIIESGNYHLFEPLDDSETFAKNWIKSQSTKAESDEYKYDGVWDLVESNSRFKGDLSMVMKSKARHHAIGAKLNKKFDFKGDNLVVQYEALFNDGQECGGAYLKLLAAPSGDLSQLNNKSPYSIMFGPDKCGNDYKLHFIFMHKNPLNGSLREIHWEKAANVDKLDNVFKDKKWHLFRLVVRPDNSFEIQVDKRKVGEGTLNSGFNPPVNPPKEIDDPNDSKPEDWDEREKIPDPDAVKPGDWDENEPRKITDASARKPADWLEEEPENIPDPEATKPADWDPEMDGEWEPPLVSNPKCAKVSGCGPWKAPLIDNPKYRGKWKPPLIDNPNYKGKWAPRKIPNPDFFEDLHPYKMLPIDAVAFELWTMSNEIGFDNILVTPSVDVANYIADVTYQVKRDLTEAETDNWFVKLIKYTNKNPWMWVVYLLVVAVPVILFIGYCCVTPGKGGRIEPPTSRKSTSEQAGEDESAKFGISGDEPSPINPDELSPSGEYDEETRDNLANEEGKVASSAEADDALVANGPDEEDEDTEADAQTAEDVDDSLIGDGEEKDGGDQEHESKPRLRKTRARKEN